MFLLNILFCTFCADGDKFDSLAGNEIKGLVDIGNFMKPHLAPVRLLQGLARNDLQQQHEFEAIAEIFLDILDLRTSLAQM